MSSKPSKAAMSLLNNPMLIDTNHQPSSSHQTSPPSPKRKISISETDVPNVQRQKTKPNIPSSDEEDREAYEAATILYNMAMGIVPNAPKTIQHSEEDREAYEAATVLYNMAMGIIPNVPKIIQHSEEDREAYEAATILYNIATGIVPNAPKIIQQSEDSELSDLPDGEDDDTIATRDILQPSLKPGETFTPHPTDPTKIIATYRITKEDGSGDFVQTDDIPKRLLTPQSEEHTGGSYFFPSLFASRCPRRVRASKGKPPIIWTPHPTIPYTWTRTKKNVIETFTLRILFRRFSASMHEYEHAYTNPKMLLNPDPNDKDWMYGFNKWLDQISRRKDNEYVRRVQRAHWSVGEVRALYAGINEFVKEKGVDKFGFGEGAELKNKDMQGIANEVNKVGSIVRGLDAVRGKVISAHEGKDRVVAELRERAADMRKKIKEGGVVAEEERFPEYAIALSEFPIEPTAAGPKAKKRKMSGKGKGRAVVDRDSDAGNDDPSASSTYAAPTLRSGTSRKRKRTITVQDNDDDDDDDDEDIDLSNSDNENTLITNTPAQSATEPNAPPLSPTHPAPALALHNAASKKRKRTIRVKDTNTNNEGNANAGDNENDELETQADNKKDNLDDSGIAMSDFGGKVAQM